MARELDRLLLLESAFRNHKESPDRLTGRIQNPVTPMDAVISETARKLAERKTNSRLRSKLEVRHGEQSQQAKRLMAEAEETGRDLATALHSQVGRDAAEGKSLVLMDVSQDLIKDMADAFFDE